MSRVSRNSLLQHTGFSLVELIVVMAIIVIIMAISLPSFISWRESQQYRQAGNELAAALRAARSKSITTNRQVELEFSGNTYRTRDGNRALASTSWTATPWVTLQTGVSLVSPNSRIIANPNGTFFFDSTAADPLFASSATAMTVMIQKTSTAEDRYGIDLSQAGRIRLRFIK